MSFIRNLSLVYKLIAIMLVTISLLIVGVVTLFNRNFDQLAEDTAREQLSELSLRVSSEFSENLADVDSTTVLITIAPAYEQVVESRDAAEARRMSLMMHTLFDLQDRTLLVGQDTYLLTGIVENNTQKQAMIAAAKETDAPQLGIIAVGEPPQIYFATARPVGGGTSVLFSSRLLDQSVFDGIASADTTRFAVWQDGQFLSHTFEDDAALQRFLDTEMNAANIQSAVENSNVIFDDLLNTAEVPVGVAYIPIEVGGQTTTVVVVRQDFQALAEFQGETGQNAILLISVLGVMAVVGATVFARRSLINPIARLKDHAQQILDGNETQQIEVRSNDEIGQLSATLNTMARTIVRRQNDYEELTTALEVEVESRIAELATAFERLEQRETYLERIFASTSDAIIVVDPATNIITEANIKALDVTNYQQHMLVGLPIEALHPGQENRIAQFLELVLKKNEGWTDQLAWKQKDGDTINVEISASVIDVELDKRIICVVRDITERKAAAEKIRLQNEALIRTNRDLALARKQALEVADLKSQFLATMSHELRTPLNAIIGYSEIILAGMTGDLNEEQQDYQNRVLQNAEHLLEMINDLLDLTKIESGRIELKDSEIAVEDLVNSTVFQMQGLAREKNIQLSGYIVEDMPRIIIGDGQRLKQIFINLISNAIKFTEHGEVNFSVSRVDEGNWQLVVSDTGVGIPSHALEYIFDEFRQADSSSRRVFGGTGLGLAIVKRLVVLMGGKISVNSEMGKGSTFVVRLPLVTELQGEF
ncbi:MAG: ATP-binding protein [Chloroflexi bacterium]|nr:ATP-binding protein [Chloroflexota bacterium]